MKKDVYYVQQEPSGGRVFKNQVPPKENGPFIKVPKEHIDMLINDGIKPNRWIIMDGRLAIMSAEQAAALPKRGEWPVKQIAPAKSSSVKKRLIYSSMVAAGAAAASYLFA